jgi:adenosylcobyric acid synthase
MLGRVIRDPARIESDIAETAGLGLLDVETTFAPEKAAHQARAMVVGGPGWLNAIAGQALTGYEIHMGRTVTPEPWLTITDRGGVTCAEPDGAISANGRIWGCYLHGLFANEGFRRAWLAALAPEFVPTSRPGATIEAALDRLADAVEAAIPYAMFERLVTERVGE